MDAGFSMDPIGLPGFLHVLADRSGPPLGRGETDRDEADSDEPSRGILVVEDEPDAREAIVELLQHEGYRAVGVEHGAAALALLGSGRRFSLILLDLMMPVMDGWEFCRALASDERYADIPVAIVTANANHDHLPPRRKDAGLFVKPIQVDRLLKAVARICS